MLVKRILAFACISGVLGLSPAAKAQSAVGPIVTRDGNWATVSQVSLVLGVSSLLVTPRVVSWPASKTGRSKASWHASFSVPTMTLLATTLFVDDPVKGLARSTRPGCTGVRVEVAGPGSNCETYGGPSTFAFAAWSTLGTGLGMFIVDSSLYGKNGVEPGPFVGGRFPVPEAIDYVLQACSALVEAHRLGIVHRDLKPANLFCAQRAGGSTVIKILDFGLSKMTRNDAGLSGGMHLTGTHLIAGSPHYMSPEQIRSLKHVDARTDVWALGVILYQLIAGQHPFSGETAGAVLAKIAADAPTPIETLVPKVPQGVRTVIVRCLEKDISKRMPSVEEFMRTLAGCSIEATRSQLSLGVAALRPLEKTLVLDAANRASTLDSSVAASGSWGTKPRANVIHSNRGRVLAVVIGAASVIAAISVMVLRFRASPTHGVAMATGQEAAFTTASPSAAESAISTSSEQRLEPEIIPPTRIAESATATVPASPSSAASALPTLPPKPPTDTVTPVAQTISSTVRTADPLPRKPLTSIPKPTAAASEAPAPTITTPNRTSTPVAKKQDVTDLWQ